MKYCVCMMKSLNEKDSIACLHPGLAAKIQFCERSCPSVCLSVCLSVIPLSQCSSHCIITKLSGESNTDKSDIHAKDQGQRWKVAVGEMKKLPQFGHEQTLIPDWIHRWLWNDVQSLKWYRRVVFLVFKSISIQVNLALILEFMITCTVTAVKSHRFALLIVKCILVSYPRWQGSWGQYGAHLGPVGPRWAPCWPHEPCYKGCSLYTYFLVLRPNARHKRERWSRTMQWIWERMLKTWTTWLPRLLLLPGVGGYYNRACCPGGHNWGCYPSTLPWASYQIRKIAGCACAGNAGNVFPATDFKGKR